MAADPNTPYDPDARTGGFVIKNMIYDGSTKGQLEVIGHWRSYEGTRLVDQYNIPPYKPLMTKAHPCYDVNRALGECSDRLDPEMLLAGRVSACNMERQALMRCLTKVNRQDAADGGVNIRARQSVAEVKGTFGSWLRSFF